MTSKTSKSITRFVAFKINGSDIDRIAAIFQQFSRSFTLTYQLSDSSSITTANVDDLKNFPNVDERKITSVKFRTDFSSNSPSIEISFSDDDTAGARISYDLSGDDNEVLYISREIDTIISSLRLPYSLLVVRSSLAIGAEAALKGCLFVLMIILQAILFSSDDKIPKNALIYKISDLIWYIFVISLIYIHILRFIFPPTCFAIGKGINRYEAKSFWRVTVLVALLVGVIGSLIAVRLEWLVK